MVWRGDTDVAHARCFASSTEPDPSRHARRNARFVYVDLQSHPDEWDNLL